MCGIAGLYAPHSGARRGDVHADIVRMTATLAHRGPNAQGHWLADDGVIALGHTRLSILDLSPAGAQPMVSHCGRYRLVYNGEIYNAAALRRQLEEDGERFRGHSDTEVLLAALAQWGTERTLRTLDGMFAFALWDMQARSLVLARDRLGEKPLYYGWHGAQLLFASELKAMHVIAGFKPALDREVLALYLRHNYVPEPLCIFRDMHKLAPGSWLELGAAMPGQLPPPQRYWKLADTVSAARAQPCTLTPAAAVSALEDTLRRAIAARMVADVPLGAFLSGGIDSSVVVALMQAHSGQPVRTFSIGFSESGYDEAPYARAVATHLGTTHTELYVSPAQAQAVIPELASIYDEPFADSSQIPTVLVARLAQQQVTVALSGDGGDELFAGYLRYPLAHGAWARMRQVPTPLRVLGARAVRAIAPRHWDRLAAFATPLLPRRLRYANVGDKLHKFASLLATSDPMLMYARLISLWNDGGPPVRDIALAPLHGLPSVAGFSAAEFIETMMYLDTCHYLPGDILAKVDRAAMSTALETRVPLLANAVVEFATQLPLAYKLRDGKSKWILREVLARHVPRALFERPKMGFGVPIDSWLRGPLQAWAAELLAPARLHAAGYFDVAAVERVWRAHLAGAQNLQYQLWGVLMFEAWRDRWGY